MRKKPNSVAAAIPVSPAPALHQTETEIEIDRDPSKLHPIMRSAMEEVIRQCEAEALPFRLFEGYRSPERQASLYAQGRDPNKPGPYVTFAKPWESYHQYGLAGDFVLFIDGKWSWDTAGKFDHYWQRLVEIGQLYRLEPLRFEKPHLQVATLELSHLKSGSYPGGGDASWEANLKAAIQEFPIQLTESA